MKSRSIFSLIVDQNIHLSRSWHAESHECVDDIRFNTKILCVYKMRCHIGTCKYKIITTTTKERNRKREIDVPHIKVGYFSTNSGNQFLYVFVYIQTITDGCECVSICQLACTFKFVYVIYKNQRDISWFFFIYIHTAYVYIIHIFLFQLYVFVRLFPTFAFHYLPLNN